MTMKNASVTVSATDQRGFEGVVGLFMDPLSREQRRETSRVIPL
jgi:hypothetical protein